MQRLLRWVAGEAAPPYSLEIQPTNRCNCNCLMCGTRIEYRRIMREDPSFSMALPRSWEMPGKRLLEIAAEAADMGVRKCLITGGGEPFVRKRTTLRLMRLLKSKGVDGNLNTNGALLTPPDAAEIMKMGWDMLMFSLDSANPAGHDRLRRKPGTWKAAMSAIAALGREKERARSSKPKIVFNTVIFNGNVSKLTDIVRLASETGCEDITFVPLIRFAEFEEPIDIDEKGRATMQEQMREVIELGRRLGVTTNAASFIETPRFDTDRMNDLIEKSVGSRRVDGPAGALCFEPFLNLVVQMDGQIGPCCMLWNRSLNLKRMSVADVWRSDYFKSLRESLAAGKLPDGCSTCVFSRVVHNQGLRAELAAAQGKKSVSTQVARSQ